MRNLFPIFLLMWLSVGAYGQQAPNIIFLLTDDLRWDALGYMGNEFVITPNIDQMAAAGVTFQNAYHTSPICMPSRAGIMLGAYLGTHSSGFDRPTNRVITRQEFEKSYPALLRKAGYYTGFIGKFGFAVRGDQKELNNRYQDRSENLPANQFDQWYGFPGQGAYFPKDDGTFNGYENKWSAKHLNEFMGFQAIDFIEKAGDRSFCLSISFKAPHAPFTPEPDLRKQYDAMEVPRMENDDPAFFGRLPEPVKSQSRNAAWYFGTTKSYRKDWHLEKEEIYQAFIKNYYALISGVDRVVGRIRETLEEKGIAGQTIIVLTSDNGFFCGSRQLTGKALLYQESIRAPMVVFDPRLAAADRGRKEVGLISHIDIAPTILDLAGLKKPRSMPGKSFVPLLSRQRESIHRFVFGENNFNNGLPSAGEVEDPSQYQSIRSKFVLTETYKYIRYQECNPVIEELWSLQDDPLETKNLIRDPAFRSVARKMRKKLDAFERKYVLYR